MAFKAYDFKAALSDSMKDYFKQAFAGALTGEMSRDEMSTLFMQVFAEKISALEDRGASATADIRLEKQDGKWVIQEFSDETLDAMFGGLYTTASKLGALSAGTGNSDGGASSE